MCKNLLWGNGEFFRGIKERDTHSYGKCGNVYKGHLMLYTLKAGNKTSETLWLQSTKL